jgi:hypothetical protein
MADMADGIDSELRAARKRLARANQAMERTSQAVSAGNAEWPEWEAALDAQLDAERDVARLTGKPFAVDLDLRLEWDVGAPLPHLLASEGRTFLVFYLKETPERWDGTWCHGGQPGR